VILPLLVFPGYCIASYETRKRRLLKSYELNCVQIVTKGQWKGFTEEQNDRWQHFAEKKDTKGTYKHIGDRVTYKQTDQ